MQFLRSTPLPLLKRKLLDGQLELLEELRIRISRVEFILAQLKENDKIVERLKSISDIGEFFAMLERHEIDKIECFPVSDNYVLMLGWYFKRCPDKSYYYFMKAKKGFNCAKLLLLEDC
ncbi:MAG: hypothetical protein ABGF52_11500 [Candidatus Asgardarchaeum sp.]